jgi:hypothetical protein
MRSLKLFFAFASIFAGVILLIALIIKFVIGYDNLMFPGLGLVINLNSVITLLVVLELGCIFLAWFFRSRFR